jgi:hypothetical protein
MRAPSWKPNATTNRPPGLASVVPGEYFDSDRDLYRVEYVDGERAVIEDCRSGDLIASTIGELLRLDRLDRA